MSGKQDRVMAEQSVIGSLLISPECLREVQRELRPNHFRLDSDRAIYTAILALQREGAEIDPVTILHKAEGMGTPVGRDYLLQLMEITPTAANVKAYVDIVRAEALRDGVEEIAQNMLDAAQSGQDPAETAVEAGKALADLSTQGSSGRLISTPEAITAFYDHREAVDSGTAAGFVRTQYQDLDHLLGGGMLVEGMYILAARPGMGKTTMAINIADRVARTDPVLFVTLEMSDVQLVAKRLSRDTGIPTNRLLMGRLTEGEEGKVAQAATKLSSLPMSINRAPAATVADVGILARSVPGLRLIVVDHIGLIRPARRAPRYEYMTEISGDLKALARTLKVPILVLCQLNRESQTRQDHRPQLSDLRDTGAIEQDADGVIFLHREDYYADKSTLDYDAPSMMEVIVEKNRHGSTGVCRMAFELSASRITGSTIREALPEGHYQMAIGDAPDEDPFEKRF